MAKWIPRCPPEAKILGSSPSSVDQCLIFASFLLHSVFVHCQLLNASCGYRRIDLKLRWFWGVWWCALVTHTPADPEGRFTFRQTSPADTDPQALLARGGGVAGVGAAVSQIPLRSSLDHPARESSPLQHLYTYHVHHRPFGNPFLEYAHYLQTGPPLRCRPGVS